jgi:hypothetical protein
VKKQGIHALGLGLLLLLLARPGTAAAPPSAALFQGTAIVVETAGLSVMERASLACRRWEKAGDGNIFFAAWAFPSSERIDSCSRRFHDGSAGGPLAVSGRNGRIQVSGERGRDVNVADAPGDRGGERSWGVMLLLYRVEEGHGWISDMQLLAPDRKYDLAGERLAWLGVADESQGLEFIRALRGQISDPGLCRDLVLAVYLLDGREAVSELIALARRDPASGVRKQAIFWLGQKASREAVKALGEVVDAPAESLELKKQAVFALSQLSGDRGTPLLLRIARENPHPRLRKEAIFWLGESGDPRALEFFEEILLK